MAVMVPYTRPTVEIGEREPARISGPFISDTSPGDMFQTFTENGEHIVGQHLSESFFPSDSGALPWMKRIICRNFFTGQNFELPYDHRVDVLVPVDLVLARVNC